MIYLDEFLVNALVKENHQINSRIKMVNLYFLHL